MDVIRNQANGLDKHGDAYYRNTKYMISLSGLKETRKEKTHVYRDRHDRG
jgi:hypothetical protein